LTRLDPRQLESLLALTGGAAYGVDREGRVLEWGASAERLFGLAAAEALGKPGPGAVSGARERLAAAIREAAAGGHAEVPGIFVQARGGARVRVDAVLGPLLEGRAGAAVVVVPCASAGETTAAERRLATVLDAIPTPIFFKDRDGVYLGCNVAFQEYLGRSRDEIVGHGVHDVAPPHLAAVYEAADDALMRSGETQVYETLVRAANGAEQYVLLTKGVLRDERGRVEGCVGTMLDISERKRAEEALRQSEERFRIMADGSPVIIWVTDPQGGNQYVNRRYREFFGVTLGEAQGGKWQPFVHPDDVMKYLEKVVSAVRERKPFFAEARVRRKDAEWRLLASHGAPRYSTTGEYLGHIGISLDITEERRLQEQFQQAQKLESVGRLAGGVAHDFNNLLTVILMCAEALKRDIGAQRPAELELIEDIAVAGERARDVARQLLAFARRQVIRPVPLDLGALVRGTEKLLRRVMGEDVEVVVTSAPALLSVRCDQGQIEQIILNLAVNARDAMPKGGRFIIDTRNAQVDVGQVASHPFLKDGPFVRLALRDTGHGMTPEVKAHAFEPFFTTKPAGQGTGLGLAMVYGIVKQSGGHILVESEPTQGTTFEIYFPGGYETAVDPSEPVAEGPTTGSETILVVEDDPQVREVTVRSLRAGGYEVLSAGRGQDALEMAPEDLGRAQLLVTDVVMPGLNGPALAEEMRRRYPDLKVLYVSGYAKDALMQRGGLEPGIEFLPKPFTAEGLLGRVRSILDARAARAGPR